ncbi:MAG: hypothetical protein EAX96_14835, partial [Candidatus Lokiarchaeota archaeon]|nr:hypothetical protein [Candidatus Lokiarchaeota archaeon]
MRNKSKIIVLGLIILLGFNFMMLPHFNTIISEILKKINQNFDLSTNNLDLLLVYTDPSGDVTGVADSTLDITYIYENRSMDLLNVTFVAPPDSGTGSEYIYELYIDSDNDNASAEYVVFHRNYTGGNESYIQNLTTYEYWNPSSLTWQSGWYNDTTLAYVVGNNLVFNFSSCSDCVGDNYYDVSAYCSIPGSVDGAIGSIYTSLSYFAGYSDKPIITNVSVSPLNALVNSNFTFYANVTDIDGIHTVSCMIKTYPTYVIIDEFELNDLGNSLYHNTWNSTGQENGIYTFEICANDSNGIERNMTNIDFFIIGDVKPSILRDDLAMDFIGIANISGNVYNSTESRGPWYYFTHYGTHTEEYFYPNNGMRAGSYYPESHETNNLTRIVTTSTGGFLPKGAFDPFWIPLTTAINETIYVYIGNGINQAFNVTGVEEFWYSQNNTEIWCWRLESELGDIAFYDNTTGILINASFYPNENDYYFYELQYTNEPIGAGPELSLESPEAYTYFFVPDVPIVLENYSSVQSAWYRNKTY